jgi:hypothetical protein
MTSVSPKAILLAKSETRAIHVSQAGRNWVCQGLGRHENDFASSIGLGHVWWGEPQPCALDGSKQSKP